MLENNETNEIQVEEKTNKTPKPFYSSPWFHALVFAVGYVGDLIISIVVQLILQSINPGLVNGKDPLFIDGLAITTSIRYALLFLILCAIILPNLLTLIKKFAEWKNLLIGIAMGAGVIVATIFYNMFVSLFTELDVNTNETYVENFIKAYPFLAIATVGILGPIVEELIYRYGLFESLNKKYKVLAYIVTIIVFALIHFDFTGDMKTELLNLPAYMIAAFLLSFTYDRFGFGASVLAHITNNMYAIVMTLLFK